ncbi:MAG: hypothetical protein WBP82_08715 [Leuconostoc mesenteroides]
MENSLKDDNDDRRDKYDGKIFLLGVQSKQCDECLFSKNKIIDDKRKEQILSECIQEETHFICHKASMQDLNAVCKGFFDRQLSTNVQLAFRLKFYELVDIT